MASMLGSGVSRTCFLQLPPATRSSLYARSHTRRSFSSTAARKSSLTDIIITGPSALLDAVHGLGMPWYAAIPVTAVLVRCTIGYYLGALPARKRAIVRTYLVPLTAQKGKIKAKEKMKMEMRRQEEAGRAVPAVILYFRFLAAQMWYNLSESHKMGKKFNAPVFTPASALNFGMLIMFAEAIRVKCGHREGMLSMIVSPFERALNSLSNNPVSKKVEQPVLSPEEALAERMEAAQAAASAQADLYASGAAIDPKLLDPAYHFSQLGQSQTANAYAESLDPSMLVEGLSWAQNLALPDSTFILPLLLSLTILTDVFNKNRQAQTIAKPKIRQIDTEITPSIYAKGSTPTSSSISTQTQEINAAMALADKIREESKISKPGSLTGHLTFGQRFRLFMAGVFFFVGCNLPAGMLLYMIPSVVVGKLQTRWLDVKYPIPNTIQPCRRPMRIKVKKEFGDA